MIKKITSSKNLKNSFWNLLEVLLAPLVFFISIPLFIEYLGEVEYGVWMFITSVVVIMQALNLGLNTSTYKHVSASFEQSDVKSIANTINTNLSLTVLLTFVCIFLTGILSLGIQYKGWFMDGGGTKSTVIIGLFIGMGIVSTKYTEQIFYNVFRAYEDFKYATFVSIGVKVLTVIGNIALAMQTQNVVYILIYTWIIACIGIATSYFIIKKLTPGYSFRFTFSKSLIKKEVNYSLFTWLQSIAIIIAYQGDKLFVSYSFGMAVLSFYAVVATMFNHIHMAFMSLTPWLFPQVAKNEGDKELVANMYLNVRNISAVLSFIALGSFCLVSKPLLSIWLGEDYVHIHEYVTWFCVYEFFYLYTITPNFFLNASGQEKLNLKLVVMYTGINIIGMLTGYFVFNSAEGVVIGLAISTVLSMFILHMVIRNKLYLKRPKMDSILLLIPSFLGSAIALSNDWYMKLVFFVICLIALYLIFVHYFKTRFTQLLD